MRHIILLFCFLFLISPLHAEITPIPQRDYLSTLTELIQSAKTSIDVEMYLIYSDSKEVRGLLDALAEAENRGVQVSMLLEDRQKANKITADHLKESGVDLTFDEPDTKLHAKKVLIDGTKLLIGSSNWTKSAFTKNNESNVLVDLAEDRDKIRILQEDYIDTLIHAIGNAKESIGIVIYSFQFLSNEDSKTYQLLETILKAYDQGCRIRIVLDSWEEGESSNEPIYGLLEQAGVDVYYDLDSIASHNKLVVIDNNMVFLGSANWTEKGLTENQEASILIRDAAASNIYSAYIDKLINALPEKSTNRVPIPVSFFQKGGLFRELYIKSGVMCVKFYTWFIWEAFNKGSFTLERDYKKWYEAVYNEPALPWSDLKSKRVKKMMYSLAEKGAIKREGRGKYITLIDMAEKTKIGSAKRAKPTRKGAARKGTDEDYIFVPQELWTLGWVGKLSGTELYGYFIHLLEFKKSSSKPIWFDSTKNLNKQYGMKPDTISATNRKLMAHNLIEIKHDIPDVGQPFETRNANIYFINPLWGEEELNAKWNKLSEAHDTDLFLKARCLAQKINEPNDPQIVSTIIAYIKIYGQEAVTEAIDTATRLSYGNGKWEMRYIIGILKGNYCEASP